MFGKPQEKGSECPGPTLVKDLRHGQSARSLFERRQYRLAARCVMETAQQSMDYGVPRKTVCAAYAAAGGLSWGYRLQPGLLPPLMIYPAHSGRLLLSLLELNTGPDQRDEMGRIEPAAKSLDRERSESPPPRMRVACPLTCER